jgi:hypothetical protein
MSTPGVPARVAGPPGSPSPGRPQRRPARRAAAATAALLVVLCQASPASAHGGPGNAVAVSYEARGAAVAPAVGGISASVVGGDQKLRLRVDAPHVVVVLGALGEPFLRFDGTGVAVNDRSPQTVAARLARSTTHPVFSPGAAPGWRRVSGSRAFAWHENRVRPAGAQPASGTARPVGPWRVPLLVDGRPAAVGGVAWYAPPPPLWPWSIPVAVVLVGSLAAARSQRAVGRAVAVVLAVLALAALLAGTLGISLASASTQAAGFEVAATFVLALVGIAALVLVPSSARPLAAGVVAVPVALEGLSLLGVFTHGFVLSTLSASLTRALLALALGASLGAIVVAGAQATRAARGGELPW